MTGEGHFIFAVTCVILAKKAGLTPELAQGNWWHLILGSLLTSLLPDIDHPQSILGQRIKWISRPIAKIFGHRGFTHSLLAIIGCIALFQSKVPADCFFPPDVFHAMIISYFSHLLADMLTPAGIPLLWPCHWRFRIPLLSTNKNNQSERIFCIVSFCFALYWQSDIAILLQPYLKQLGNLFSVVAIA